MDLTHINQNGEARMVDVGEKQLTARTATAEAVIHMKPETLERILAGNMKKGDVFGAARIAAIQAAKRTWELIPLCHPIPISAVDVRVEPRGRDAVAVRCTAQCVYATGIEMEALCAASVGALTVYDMCKAIDRGIVVGETRLLYKAGGKSGVFNRAQAGEVLSVRTTGGDGAEMLVIGVTDAQEVGQQIEKALDSAYRQFEELPELAVVCAIDPEQLKSGAHLRIGGTLSQLETVFSAEPERAVWARAHVLEQGEIYPGAQIEVAND